MTLNELLAAVYSAPESLEFQQVLAAIDAEFEFTPAAFSNGTVNNSETENQGSCKVLSFAHQAGLSEAHTLQLFAEHYRSVLASPDGSDHQNIRQFMAHGWKGVSFSGKALVKRA
ncbi:HopJ type III effector protein [Reinekea marinisedimentorum]|uniref:HopJ type III effector protein n=1 Tax=Reinekea marinisedimentorum TaxID=230495 RepID=A0A4V2UKB7_9GAMM|nr:HopJ type III effector protein [Reinekea marinisedimentorum]TCS43753.1 HopJ type III effector protein [Reinekea marinisedimentorum]